MPRTRQPDNPMPPEGCWIRYMLDLRNIKFEEIAKKSGRTVATVSRVISGVRQSKKVEAALAEALGYPSWERLRAAAFINAERRAV